VNGDLPARPPEAGEVIERTDIRLGIADIVLLAESVQRVLGRPMSTRSAPVGAGESELEPDCAGIRKACSHNVDVSRLTSLGAALVRAGLKGLASGARRLGPGPRTRPALVTVLIPCRAEFITVVAARRIAAARRRLLESLVETYLSLVSATVLTFATRQPVESGRVVPIDGIARGVCVPIPTLRVGRATA